MECSVFVSSPCPYQLDKNLLEFSFPQFFDDLIKNEKKCIKKRNQTKKPEKR